MIVHFCEENNVDIESVPKLLSKPLKEKLKYEAYGTQLTQENISRNFLYDSQGDSFDAYKSYLGLKNHFTKPKYDYHKYCGKSRSSLQSFYKRRDRFFFEKLSRSKKDDAEVIEFFVSNFVACDDPQSLWIGEIMSRMERRVILIGRRELSHSLMSSRKRWKPYLQEEV